MSETSELVKVHSTIIWKIHNFSFRRKDQESTITSPKFMTRCVDALTWSFDLYPKGKTNHDFIQFAAQLHFSGSRDVVEFYITSVHFDISIVDVTNQKKFRTEFSYVPTFTEPQSKHINFIPLESFQEDTHLYNKWFIVLCSITTCINQKKFRDLMNSADAVSVVSCVKELMISASRSDMRAHSSGKEVFLVHGCILRARCPTIFSNSDRQPNWFSGISPDVLNLLLNYLYGFSMFEVPHHLNRKLLSVARQYQLLELERELVSYTGSQLIETKIVVEERVAEILLDNEMSEFGPEGRENEYIPLSDRFHFVNLKVFFSVEESLLKMDINVSILMAGKHIFMKCLLYLLHEDGTVLKSFQHRRSFFKNNEVWTLTPHILTWSVYNALQPNRLRCCFLFSEASFEDVDRSEHIEDRPYIVNNHPLMCAKDLLNMFENPAHTDLEIVAEGQVFHVHKCFLEQRSRLIKEALNTDERHVHALGIPFMSARICQKVLIYMYSGRINVSDRETAKELVEAAKYFHLPLLAIKMTLFNSEHL